MASVADQAGVEVEHIIQDAGSEGNLEWLVSKGHVRLFIEPDAGMYDAINRGLRRSTGEICSYLNCDEQYLTGTLAKVARFFVAHPEVDVLFGDIILINSDGRPLSYRRTVLPTLRHLRLAHLNTATCATFFRRSLLERGFYFDPQWKTIGDAVWMETLIRHGVSMATLYEPLAVFTFTGRNLGSTEMSRTEALNWKGRPFGQGVLKKLAVKFWHRIRKALAGAYRRRRVEIDIFTPASPAQRQHIVKDNLGFGWPRSATNGTFSTTVIPSD